MKSLSSVWLSPSLHGIFQARVLEWIAVSFSSGSSRPRDRIWVSPIPGRRFNLSATRESWAPTFNLHANGLAITASRLHRYTLISQTRSVSLRSRGSRPHMLSAQASQSLTLHLIPASLCFSHPLKPFLPLSQRNSVLAAPQVCSLNLLTLLSISEMFNSIVDSPFVKWASAV